MSSDYLESICGSLGLTPPLSSTLLDGGISDVYRVADGSGRRVIVKIYRPEWEWKLLKELFVYGLLQDVQIPTPAVLHSDASHDLVPQAFLVLECLDGEPLRALKETVPDDQQQRLWRQTGAMLAKINSVRLDQFGYIVNGVIDGHPTNRAYMLFQIDKKLGDVEVAGGDQELTSHVRAIFAQHTYALDVAEFPYLCHDDLHDGNLLVMERDAAWDLTGVVDVENAVAADPLLDVAKTVEYCLSEDALSRNAFLAGYGDLGDHWTVRVWLYRLYHLVEIYAWFAHTGQVAALEGVAANLKTRAEAGPAH